jgi:hypothetical protein
MSDVLIYTGPTGVTATLTTDSPASHYGCPALRIEAEGMDDLPDLGPADVLPSGLTAAELVCRQADCLSEAGRKAAKKFLAQWPDGPQLT